MSFEVPDELKYVESHEWVRPQDGTVRLGITDFAQDELGDIVFVELPGVDSKLAADEAFGVVESIKAVSDLYAPVGGTVTAVNEELFDAPELVNDDPYGDGWMIDIELDDEGAIDDLLDPDAYREQIA